MKEKKWDEMKKQSSFDDACEAENKKDISGENDVAENKKKNGSASANTAESKKQKAGKKSTAEAEAEKQDGRDVECEAKNTDGTTGNDVGKDENAKTDTTSNEDKCTEDVTITQEEASEILNKFASLNDKYLHVVAEYDNYRKRAQKERDAAYSDATADVLKEMLPVVDNLERATTFTDSKSIGEGVSMTLNQFNSALAKLGVESFGESGEVFDPNIHNAVMHIEDEAYGENVIVDVFQKGYKKGDKIIRFAMVKVAN